MNKFSLLLLVSLSAFSQKEIVNVKLTKDLPAIGFEYSYFDDKLIIANAYKATGMATYFNSASYYDENGLEKPIINSGDFVAFWLGAGFSIRTMDAGANCDYYSGGQKFNKKGAKSSYYMSLDSNNEYDMGDKKGKSINFEKDDLYLTKYNYKTGKSDVILLAKPSLDRYKNGVSKPKSIGAFYEITTDGQIDVITKTGGPTAKNMTNTTMYRTIYDDNGKLLHDYAYSCTISSGSLLQMKFPQSKKPFTEVDYTYNYIDSGVEGPVADLDLNKHYIDLKTRDVYIYGVIKQADEYEIYIAKFKENGEKIWQKTYTMYNPKSLKKMRLYYMTVEAAEGNFYLNVKGEYSASKDYNLFYKIAKQDGQLVKNAYQDSDVFTGKGTFTVKGGTGTLFHNQSIQKNKFSNGTTFMAMAFNEKLKNYVEKVPAKQDVYFSTYFTDKGLWLVEGDNKTYLKVNLFEY